jgi:hypothetical protein
MQTFSRKCGLSQSLPTAILIEIDEGHGTKVPDRQLCPYYSKRDEAQFPVAAHGCFRIWALTLRHPGNFMIQN